MPATPRRQLNVRLPPDLVARVDADDRSKQEVVEDALRAYFDDSSMIADDSKVLSDDSSENGSGRTDDSRIDSTVLSNDSSMIAALTGQLGVKDQQIAELHVMLRDAISSQAQLPPAPGAEGGRKWWQVWKW